jgi:nucleoside-triphosphatase
VQGVIVQIFVTGCPGVGKTTACIKAIELLRQRDVREENTRTGFEFVDVETRESFTLSSTRGTGPLMGKYHVNLAGIARAVSILRDTPADVIFIDELGLMELKSRDFQGIVDGLVHGSKNLVLVVHNKLASKFPCIEITVANREAMPAKIAGYFSRS